MFNLSYNIRTCAREREQCVAIFLSTYIVQRFESIESQSFRKSDSQHGNRNKTVVRIDGRRTKWRTWRGRARKWRVDAENAATCFRFVGPAGSLVASRGGGGGGRIEGLAARRKTEIETAESIDALFRVPTIAWTNFFSPPPPRTVSGTVSLASFASPCPPPSGFVSR